MTHYLRSKDGILDVKVEMGCKHPDIKNNSTESIGCNGECESCNYGNAELSIKDFLELARRANCIYTN